MLLARHFRMRRDGLQPLLEKCITISATFDEIDAGKRYPDIKLFKKFFKKSSKIANLIASGAEDYMRAKEVISKRGDIGVSTSCKRRRLEQIITF